LARVRSGKTLSEHKADRATVVREALLAAGIVAPEMERMSADVLSADGLPRFIWTDETPDPATYAVTLLQVIAEQQRWRAQYEAAKNIAEAVDGHSATDEPPDRSGLTTTLGLPDNQPSTWSAAWLSGVSAANPQDTKCP
jgi:hypothetical protein